MQNAPKKEPFYRTQHDVYDPLPSITKTLIIVSLTIGAAKLLLSEGCSCNSHQPAIQHARNADQDS